MLSLGPIGFAAPWLLLGLLALPAIWWLLRITPPGPKRVAFPPIRILRQLNATEETPAATPLWLTLLRLALAALAVLALSHPLWNPGTALQGDGPLLLVVDNGWAAAPDWRLRQQAMDELLDQAARQERQVRLLATAPPPSNEPIAVSGLLRPHEARTLAQALAPMPWPTDRRQTTQAVARLQPEPGTAVVWLSDGLEEGDAAALGQALNRLGRLSVFAPSTADHSKALGTPELSGDGLAVPVLRAPHGGEESVAVRALAEGGRLIARGGGRLRAGEDRVSVSIQVPSDLRAEVQRVELEGSASAGAVLLIDERWRRRPVGLTAGGESEERAQPLLSGTYYLQRALAPFSDVVAGDLGSLLQRPLSVIVLDDIGQVPEALSGSVTRWIEEGGVLVRFAGPRLAQGEDTLIPVRLRSGGRMLGGALSWSQPARLAPFGSDSPFSGLSIPPDVVVHSQVLAEPSLDLAAKTWARLEDGTPLVTAEKRGQGWIVLFHVTANTAWSNLPLSGLFVEMLRHTARLSRGVAQDSGGGALPPLANLDGHGRLTAPAPAALPLPGDRLGESAVGPLHPPGFYGGEDSRRAHNLAGRLPRLEAVAHAALPGRLLGYQQEQEVDLKPWLLAAAVLLLLADLGAVLALRGLLRPRAAAGTVTALLLLAGTPPEARAQSEDAFALAATLETRLAYVLTGDGNVDAASRAGLVGLSEVLRRRTSVEPADPIGIEVERHELVFFPLLYWPVTAGQPRLSEEAVQRIGNYMRTGGTILFDTRDAQGSGRSGRSENAQHLRRLLQRLDVPPLTPVPQEHVLTKSFYLMQRFPGRYDGSTVWVESRAENINDGVSPLVIGGNDWAGAWAMDDFGRPMNAVVPGGEEQREMAFRFGVNLVMYTLTGNYKADQVHVPAILERLGQ